MLKKLHMSLIFSILVVSKQLSTIIVDMRNFVTKFGKILEICKKFAGNQVNERGNVTRCGVVPTFSDLEVVALSITAEAFSIDSENYLFNRLNSECPGAIPNLITRRQYNRKSSFQNDFRCVARSHLISCVHLRIACFHSSFCSRFGIACFHCNLYDRNLCARKWLFLFCQQFFQRPYSRTCRKPS